MKHYFLTAILSLSIISCTKETPKVRHVKMKPKNDLKGIKVVNAEDPICLMKTAEFLKDTAVYKNKIYGFCSDHCKSEFKKDPEKYAHN